MTTDSSAARSSTTAAFFAMAAISFGVSLVAMTVGVIYLPVDEWVRAFLCVGMLYTITSAFTLAKVVRDRQEENQVMSRVDRAKLEKLLAEHDPFKTDS